MTTQETIYMERANGRWEYWCYDPQNGGGERFYLSTSRARQLECEGKCRIVRVWSKS